jgi:hypothetical protein
VEFDLFSLAGWGSFRLRLESSLLFSSSSIVDTRYLAAICEQPELQQ